MRNFKTILLLFFTVSIVLSCKKQETKKQIENVEVQNIDVQKILDEAKNNFKIGGVVASVYQNNGTFNAGAIGNSETDVPLTTKMSLGIGSNTKTFTATLIFKLTENNKLSLHKTVKEIIPEVINDNISGNITVLQLLNHSSGLFDPLNESDAVINNIFKNPSHAYSWKEFFALIKKPYFKNGEKHQYSNTNYMLLGLIIEKISGKKYHEYLRETILNPLNLSGTFVAGKENSTNKIGYSWGPDGSNLKDFPREGIESIAWAAGSIFSTVKDISAWYNALFTGKIINQKSLDIMLHSVAGDYELNYGAGIFTQDYKGSTIYLHTGQTIAYTSIFIFDKKTKSVITAIVNQIENSPEPLAFKLLDAAKK